MVTPATQVLVTTNAPRPVRDTYLVAEVCSILYYVCNIYKHVQWNYLYHIKYLTRIFLTRKNIDHRLTSTQCQTVPFSRANSLGGLMTTHRQNEECEGTPWKEYGHRHVPFTPASPQRWKNRGERKEDSLQGETKVCELPAMSQSR